MERSFIWYVLICFFHAGMNIFEIGNIVSPIWLASFWKRMVKCRIKCEDKGIEFSFGGFKIYIL